MWNVEFAWCHFQKFFSYIIIKPNKIQILPKHPGHFEISQLSSRARSSFALEIDLKTETRCNCHYLVLSLQSASHNKRLPYSGLHPQCRSRIIFDSGKNAFFKNSFKIDSLLFFNRFPKSPDIITWIPHFHIREIKKVELGTFAITGSF